MLPNKTHRQTTNNHKPNASIFYDHKLCNLQITFPTRTHRMRALSYYSFVNPPARHALVGGWFLLHSSSPHARAHNRTATILHLHLFESRAPERINIHSHSRTYQNPPYSRIASAHSHTQTHGARIRASAHARTDVLYVLRVSAPRALELKCMARCGHHHSRTLHTHTQAGTHATVRTQCIKIVLIILFRSMRTHARAIQR